MDIKTIVTVLFILSILAEIACSWSLSSRYYIDAQNYISKTKKSSTIVKDLKNLISTYDGLKVHSLEGLGEFLQPVQHCLIHMTNFGGVDLPGLAVASIQRKTKLTVCHKTIYAISSSLELRHNTSSARHRKLSCEEAIPKCPLSPLFVDSKCVGLNFRRFVTRIRPWTCEVIVSIYQKQMTEYPHSIALSYTEQTENQLSVFEERDSNSFRYVHYSIPSWSPINILITEEEYVLATSQTLESPNAIGAWLKFSLENKLTWDINKKQIFRDTFFVVFTEPLALNMGFALEHYDIHYVRCAFAVQLKLSFGKYEIHFLKANTFLKNMEPIMTRQESSSQSKIFDASDIGSFVFATPLFKEASVLTPEKFLYESICKTMYLRLTSSRHQTSGELYSVKWVGEWLQILRRYNYTFLYNFHSIRCSTHDIKLHEIEFDAEFVGCSNIIGIHDKISPTAVSHPLALDDPIRKMGFISCGSSAVQALAFRELFRVFDGYLWTCLVVFNLIIMPVVLCIIVYLSDKNQTTSDLPGAVRKISFSSRFFFQPVIILLEQGGAFTNKNLNAAALRWVAAALILVAIVLSNSYKYDNVYNIMLPRKKAPLWFFHQLIKENFSIYTRTSYVYLDLRNRDFTYAEKIYRREFKAELSGHATFLSDNNSEPAVIYSELITIYIREADILQFLSMEFLSPWQEENGPNNGSIQETLKFNLDVFGNLLKNTKLHPLEKTLPHHLILGNVNGYTILQLMQRRKEFESQQAHKFLQILKECQNTAFVLPYANIVNLFTKLRNHGNSKLTIGKEILLERNIGMALQGWISNHLIYTIGWFQDFGYWKHVRNIYWKNLTSIAHVNSDYTHQTSQISGNILVIFVTLLCGHSLAVLSYIFEIRKEIYILLVSGVKSVYNILGKIWSRSQYLNVYGSSRCRTAMKHGLFLIVMLTIVPSFCLFVSEQLFRF
ncbi:unnamed protein product [Orchesella dallaii]|uniref:Uncharacterized protein n=1 Tax=Orchesella dallaii TaxID=48710 RepID=A0ABP1S869_9HEXA